MALKYPAMLQSNNPNGFGIVDAKEVAGHRCVKDLDSLYELSDPILSLSGNNTDNDALGQLWYVSGEGKFYQLIDWANRKTSAGWEEFKTDVDLSDYAKKGDLDSKANVADVNTLQGNVEGLVDDIQGLNSDIQDNAGRIKSLEDADFADKTYVDEKVSSLVNGAPETLDTLNEIAEALKDNADIVDVLNDSISSKADAGKVTTLEESVSQNATAINGLEESKAEKSTVTAIQNTLNAENPPVAKPTISVDWIAHNSDGTELDSVPNEGGTASSPIVETGYKMRYEATYSWRSAEGYQDPTSVDTSNSDWKDESTPPGSGVSSESIVLDSPTVTSNKTLKITLQAKEVGLKTNSDGYLVPASGFVKSSASVGVTFRNRLYYGVTTAAVITEEVIKSLGFKSLVQNNAQTLTGITQTDEQYFVYASTSRITSIIQDGATPVLGAFIETQVSVTNAAGYSRTYYVYRTTNKKAFTNATLKFA